MVWNAAAAAMATLGLVAGGATADTCGMPDAAVPWIDDTAEASNIAEAPRSLRANIRFGAGGQAGHRFRVGRPGWVRIEAVSRTGGDPVIELRDSLGYTVLWDDDGGSDLNARAEAHLAAGDYCVFTTEYDGYAFDGEIGVGRRDHAALDPYYQSDNAELAANCAASPEAEVLGIVSGTPGDELVARVWPSTERFYVFGLETPAPVTIVAEDENADPILELFDADGRSLAWNDDAGPATLNAQIDIAYDLPAGRYCLLLDSYDVGFRRIRLEIARFDPLAHAERRAEIGAAPPPPESRLPVLGLGMVDPLVEGTVTPREGISWARFELAERKRVVIDAAALSDADPMIDLFNPAGMRIASSDDWGTGLNAHLEVVLDPGVYHVAVTDLHGMAAPTVLGLFAMPGSGHRIALSVAAIE
jgi:hypothetical protein